MGDAVAVKTSPPPPLPELKVSTASQVPGELVAPLDLYVYLFSLTSLIFPWKTYRFGTRGLLEPLLGAAMA